MPSILRAISPASSALLASFTPPPFPRPPAWIWALTTQTGLFASSSRAAATASSGVLAGLRGGTQVHRDGRPRKGRFRWYNRPAKERGFADPDPRRGAGDLAQGARAFAHRHPRAPLSGGRGAREGARQLVGPSRRRTRLRDRERAGTVARSPRREARRRQGGLRPPRPLAP